MNARRGFFIGLIFTALLIAYLHFLANKYYLYFEFWWFDILMHFLGGVLVSGGALWWLKYEVPIFIRKKISPFLFALVSITFVGMTWEIFEYITGMYYAVNYSLDTTLDLLTDLVGMLVAYLVFSRYSK